MGGGVGESIGGALSSLGDWVAGGTGQSTPVQAAAQEPSISIQTPAQSVDRFTVSMEELGNFSPPAVGVGASRGAGMDMASFG
jgi:hypothetical protein